MIKRIVEISNPAKLAFKNRQMVIKQVGFETTTIPVEDLGVLILDHPAIIHTQGILSACSENNVAVVVCGRKHLPSAVFLPFEGNTLHTKTIRQQIEITEPLRKRLWQTIIKAKIHEQAKVLNNARGDSDPLLTFMTKVKSGDPENIESQAARIYWQKLFGSDFQRDRFRLGTNALLNYGYTVMRAAVARAIVGTGLHPALGLHHHNQYNSFCLADDLLEPLRPAVDMTVFQIAKKVTNESMITIQSKKILLEILNRNSVIGKSNLPLFVALHHYAASLRKVICKESKKLEIPELL